MAQLALRAACVWPRRPGSAVITALAPFWSLPQTTKRCAPSACPYSVCPKAPDRLYSEPFNTHKTQNGLHVCHGMMVLSQGPDERSPGVLSHNLSVCESTQERVCTWAFFLTLPRICNWLLWDAIFQVSSSE